MSISSRLSLLALLALPLTAAAGPIDWTFTSRWHAVGEPNTPFVYIGAGGSGAGNSYMLSAALQDLSGMTYPAPGSGPYITLGHYEHRTDNAAWQMPPTFERDWELHVTVTDTASGETGVAN